MTERVLQVEFVYQVQALVYIKIVMKNLIVKMNNESDSPVFGYEALNDIFHSALLPRNPR